MNQTALLANAQPHSSFQPCSVFAILQPETIQHTLNIAGHGLHLVWSEPSSYDANIVVYLPDEPVSAPPRFHDSGSLGRAPPHYNPWIARDAQTLFRPIA
jgi:hypothetical protein